MKTNIPSPDVELRCLLVQPAFSAANYWNYRATCELIGAKTPSPPLGLLTVAAILPQHWQFRLVDLNVASMTEQDWDWAEIVCVGGMLPQQAGILEVIREAKRRNIFVAVGGADPTSQPEIYEEADARVLGEGEATIPLWLESWRAGERSGRFECAEKPDVSRSPTPRFDLVKFDNYVHIGVQYSRGCPFNCEFCDIIELYGRKPRWKTAEQLITELELLYQLGYRGWVDIVDDNFIGNKRNIKKMLPEIRAWCERRKYPFFFSTEASMNLADDKPLMELMADCDFRYVFMGIETPDPELLLKTQKSQNTMRPVVDRVRAVYEHGISVSAGYILGFDGEKTGVDRVMIDCIRESSTIMAMVGLLVALPNTQLTRRLQKEGRLLTPDAHLVKDNSGPYRVSLQGSTVEGADQTAGGLNFVTLRDRVEILDEYARVIQAVYSPQAFMDRVLETAKLLKPRRRHWPKGWELRRNLLGLIRVIGWMMKRPEVRHFFLRNAGKTMAMGVQKFDFAMNMMGMFVHFSDQTEMLLKTIAERRALALTETNFPRSVVEKAS